MNTYHEYIESKRIAFNPESIVRESPLNDALFDFQKKIVTWALARGRAAIFADCGLGKTLMQLEWASHVPGDVLILTPLAVARQTEQEAIKFGIDASISRDGTKTSQITITNYEQLHKFNIGSFKGIVLDESSILKSYTGKIRNAIIDAASSVSFRLACTATPAPNDHMELGNHAEFIGAMSRVEMLSTFFVHDGGDTAKWRLKGHARGEFWRWISTWAVAIRTPADMGCSALGYELPPMNVVEHLADSDFEQEGVLFPVAMSLSDQRAARRASMDNRVKIVSDLCNESNDQWLVWCELNAEGDALASSINGAVQVSGSDTDDAKTDRMLAFSRGEIRVLVTKPKIAGFGMNWQNCHKMAFVGVTHSYERFYQAVRRCWRFGQSSPVDVHIVLSEPEKSILANLKRKQSDAESMIDSMVGHVSSMSECGALSLTEDDYMTEVSSGEGWAMQLGDCVEGIGNLSDDSVHYTVFSPPFASLYTYSASARDMGNCSDHDTFFGQFAFLIDELFRVTMPGRLLSFHCMNLPTSKARDGVIGLSDFRGELIRRFVAAGWIYHSEVCIWKDPVTAMQRTKALGLLHKQIKKDSAMSRQGIADYLVTMRKPGDNPERVTHTSETFPVDVWQRYASPVWMDIRPNDTIQFRSARAHEDERHICPLQLDVIRRAVNLWSNPGDVVLSPFAGIGSEGYVAVSEGRRFVGFELKESYFRQACRNIESAEPSKGQLSFIVS
jgi:superfamily II DNA or RNA helicase